MKAPELKPASTMRTKGQGVGPVHAFLCAGCGKTKGTLGRKARRIAGLRVWVCAQCARAGRQA